MRQELREALLRLEPRASAVLQAAYGAGDDGALVDAENVLLYNVGSKALRALMRTGVRFERSFSLRSPPAEVQISGAVHYQRYAMVDPGPGFDYWRPGELLGAFTGVRVPVVDKPITVWAAIRDQAEPPPRQATAPVRFMARVRVGGPVAAVNRPRSLVDLIKPLLDGVVSAFHSHQEPKDPPAGRQLVTPRSLQREWTAGLTDARWAALGPRRLVTTFGTSGVKWNPADDYCVAAEVLLDDQTTQVGWTLDAQLHSAIAINYPGNGGVSTET